VSDHPIFALSDAIVDELARLFPSTATELGVAGHDDRWPDLSPDGAATTVAALSVWRRRIDDLPPAEDRWDRLAVEVATEALDEDLDAFAHDDHLRALNSIASPLQDFTDVFDHMGTETLAQWESIATRLERLPAALDGYRATLEQGRRHRLVVARRQVDAAVTQCEVAARPDTRFGRLVAAFAASHDDAALGRRLREAADGARDAFATFGRYLADVYGPDATPADAVGEGRYVREADRFLGTVIDPAATYAWGWDEVARIGSRLRTVAGEIVSGADLTEVRTLLKTDPARAAADASVFVDFMQQRLDEALDRLAGTHFDIPAQIRRITVNIAPPGGPLGAYYVGPSEDFTRPGAVWWSLAPGGPYPLYDEVSTAYHEGFPGHHLQVGVQASRAGTLSRLHRMWVWKPGAGEGWALYAERLMDELGFFERPDYAFGWLTSQMLRACRVVIDIGCHLRLPIPRGQEFHPGGEWSYATAVELLERFAMLDRPYAESEVVRYLGWPAQAISYKVGEQAILELREDFRARHGAAFDAKRFHAALLDVGPVGLDLLRRQLLT
jgi:uncharacterized protein (DUF885 family)